MSSPRHLIHAQAALLELVDRIEGGCWAWLGSMRDGRPVFRLDGQVMPAPLASWLLFVAYPNGLSRLADGLELRHTCGTGACTNPVHLVAGTTDELILAGVHAQHARERRPPGGRCLRGHPQPAGDRVGVCRPCATHYRRPRR